MRTEQIKKIVESRGWKFICLQEDNKMVSFTRNGERMNVWDGRRGLTVSTAINHPKLGKTQLYRKNCTLKELETIAKKPRTHTDKGYRVKKPVIIVDEVTDDSYQVEITSHAEPIKSVVTRFINDMNHLRNSDPVRYGILPANKPHKAGFNVPPDNSQLPPSKWQKIKHFIKSLTK